ncbi:hypothetical protein [Nibricoccus sp. IMCC34717]|uniref:hypothetical protein n=1 Tax=Nibricoccus sp. IMCC34717 TaxID=3034021 RepID=UPI00385170A3
MPRRLHVTHFSIWAGPWEDTGTFLARFEQLPLPVDPKAADRVRLERMARLDRAWYAETSRCFAALGGEELEWVSPRVAGPQGLAQMIAGDRDLPEEKWLVFEGQTPAKLKELAGKVCGALAQRGWRILYYSFDESSRRMPVFHDIAPHLSVLIHDEGPLEPTAAAKLRADCVRVHRSWVANLVPFAALFVEEPEKKILFLGSQLGLTPHRQRQIDFLKRTFKDRFTAYCDHSVPVGDRLSLGKTKVSVCPEGRMFASPTMAATHTDRPFWSGCLGMVPVSEDSAAGGRLQELHEQGLILRYAHADLQALAKRCEEALELPNEQRRRIYEHFNRHETVGSVVAEHLGRHELARGK